MKTKSTVELIPQGDNKYTVIMNQSSKKICFCCIWKSRIIIALLVAACFGFSALVFSSIKDCEITLSTTSTYILKDKKHNVPPSSNTMEETSEFTGKTGTHFDYIRKPQRPHRPDKIVQKKVNLYLVFCIVYVLILAVTIATLLVLFVKDDSYIKCAKLNALREVKEMLSSKEFENSVDETEKVVKSNVVTETTDNRVKLLKHYMSCVADI